MEGILRPAEIADRVGSLALPDAMQEFAQAGIGPVVEFLETLADSAGAVLGGSRDGRERRLHDHCGRYGNMESWTIRHRLPSLGARPPVFRLRISTLDTPRGQLLLIARRLTRSGRSAM
jgi:hypothetical protein